MYLCGRSLFWLGHKPPTQDLTNYREYLNSKFSIQYARLQYGYIVKYGSLMDNPSEINNIPLGIRSNVLKSLINLSKYLGKYESFKARTAKKLWD
jgi:hypothetical protein